MANTGIHQDVDLARVKAGLSSKVPDITDDEVAKFARQYPIKALSLSGVLMDTERVKAEFNPKKGNYAAYNQSLNVDDYVLHKPSQVAKAFDSILGEEAGSNWERGLYNYYASRDPNAFTGVAAFSVSAAEAVPGIISALVTEPIFGTEISTPLSSIKQGIDQTAGTKTKILSGTGSVAGSLYGGSAVFNTVSKGLGLVSKGMKYVPQMTLLGFFNT